MRWHVCVNVCVLVSPLLHTFSSYDSQVLFKAFVHPRLSATFLAVNASVTLLHVLFSVSESRTRTPLCICFVAKCSCQYASISPRAETLPPSASSVSVLCASERTCDGDSSGRLSILIRSGVGGALVRADARPASTG